jgi:D-glycero-D-manno-heptose 1,7-bisphosphate phosphatase
VNKALFLDRDGVINVDRGYVYRVEDFVFMPRIFDLLKIAQRLDYRLIVCTNQSGIERGYYTLEDFLALNEWMLSEFKSRGILITAVYHCPHAPQQNCFCRKPNPGMFLEAIADYAINAAESFMIGDKPSDIEAARRAGVVNGALIDGNNPNALLDIIALFKAKVAQ